MTVGDLYLDRKREVWRRVHGGSLVRLTLGGCISPAIRAEKVEADWGPLRELAPLARYTVNDLDRIRAVLDQLATDTAPGETGHIGTYDAYESAIDAISRIAYPEEAAWKAPSNTQHG